MRIAIASDHGGFAYKQALVPYLKEKAYDLVDLGPSNEDSVDYPDFAQKVAKLVASHEVDYGILICKSAIGMYIAANRIKGARAVHCYSAQAATSSRQHNNANIACFGSAVQPLEEVKSFLDIFLKTEFSGDRHALRVKKLDSV